MLFREDSVARAQHQAVRENAGWYRWTHDLVEVKGKDALAFLDRLFVNNIAKADIGRTKYTTMLNEDGKIIDDTIVMHMGENLYWVSTLYAPQMVSWMDAHKGDSDVDYRDMTGEMDMYAIQGPNSPAVMNTLLSAPVDNLKRFQVADNKIGDIPVIIHRSLCASAHCGFHRQYFPGHADSGTRLQQENRGNLRNILHVQHVCLQRRL